MEAPLPARAASAAATAALAAWSQVGGESRSPPGTLGEPSVTTNMTFGTPARSWALLAAPELIPAAVGVRPVGLPSALTAPLNVAASV